MIKLSAILRYACLALGLATPAVASPFDDLARLDVIPGWQTSSGTHMAALRVILRPGWKTYWRAPGDGGIPAQFTWGGSENIATAQIHWPTPRVIDQGGMTSIGYYDSLVLPIELTQTHTSAATRLAGEVTIGVCEDICVPVTLPFAADLPAGGRRDGTITASLLNRPHSAKEGKVRSAVCAISAAQDGITLTATIGMPPAGHQEHVVVEAGNPEVWVSEADITRSGNLLQATVDMVHATSSSFALDRSAIRITVLGSDHAVDIKGCDAG